MGKKVLNLSKLEKFDKNMASGSTLLRDEALFFPDCFATPFRLSGFAWYHQDGKLHRLPEAIAREVSEGVAYLATQTAGGTLSFRTDSNRLYLEATVVEGELSPKFAPSGRCGFDIYMRRDDHHKLVYVKTMQPDPGSRQMSLDIPDISALMLEGSSKIVEIRINLPPYDGVESLELGLERDCQLLPPAPYALEKPVVFYGSSITQGCCAGRPGNAYPHHLCRRLNTDLINLGFSGSAKGEPRIAQAIATLEMSAFVLDYDHNAPTLDHLEATHEDFYRTIRAAQPEVPIIMLTRPTYTSAAVLKRRDVVRHTYEKAVQAGDQHVYFIDGQTLFGTTDRDACTVDGTHPNDLGFLRMADTIEPVLREALGL